MKLILMVDFSGILVTGQVEDRKMIKGKLIDGKKLVRKFKGKLVEVIRDAGSRFDDYSISLKIRQILLHWGYELPEENFFNELSNQRIKMSYYWFNRQEILQKEKERYSKEKAAEYYE